MIGRKTASSKIDGVVERAVNYEVTVADLARRSERRAWWVASGSMLMSLVLAAGYFYVLPLKEKVPYLIMADAYTGNATVARLRGDFSNNAITASEAVNRANVATFRRAASTLCVRTCFSAAARVHRCSWGFPMSPSSSALARAC